MYTEFTPTQQKRISELINMTDEQWDKICKGCGLCCLCKIQFWDSAVYYTDVCCEHLDTNTHKCTVFNNRFNITQDLCAKVDLHVVLNQRVLPRTCGYVEYVWGPASNPINIDWRRVQTTKNVDLENIFVAIKHRIKNSAHWNQR